MISSRKDQVYKTQKPFKKVTKKFMIYLVFQSIKMLNHVSVRGGIYDTIRPTTIMRYKSLHYKNILVYILDNTAKYMSKTLPKIEISHIPKVPYS